MIVCCEKRINCSQNEVGNFFVLKEQNNCDTIIRTEKYDIRELQ